MDSNEPSASGTRREDESIPVEYVNTASGPSLAEMQRVVRESEFLRRIALKANEAASADEAIQTCLDKVCAYTGWPIGHAYLSAADGSSDLKSAMLWHIAEPVRYENFRRITEAVPYSSLQGLPRRVFADAEPQWMVSDTTYQSHPRANARIEAGLKSGFAFPALAGDRVVAVLEFFSPETIEPDPRFLAVAVEIGILIGQVLNRIRSEQALADSEVRYRQLAELSPDGMLVHVDGEIAFANNSLAQMLANPSTDDLIGRQAIDLLAPEFRAGAQQRRDNVLKGKVSTATQVEFLRDDGSRVPVERTATRVTWDGKPAVVILFRNIAERLAADKALQDSRVLLRAVADHSPSAIFIKDPDGGYIFANKIWHDIYNPAGVDITGKTAHDFFPPEIADPATAEDARVFETGKPVVAEQHLPNSEGEWRSVLTTKFPVRDGDGNIVGIGAVNTDITERVEIERALRDSEARLRAIIDNSNSLILLKGLDGRFQYVGKSFEVAYGIPAEEVIGKTSYELAPGEFADWVTEQDRQVIESGKPIQEELPVVFADGSPRTLLVTKFPVRDGAGNLVGVGGINSDVTERVAVERALRESEARLRAFMDNIPAVMHWKDLDGCYEYVNKLFEDWFGISQEHVIGRTVRDVFGDGSNEPSIELEDNLRHEGDQVQSVVEMNLADGSVRKVLNIKFRIYDSDGEHIGYGTFASDVTEREKMEHALRESEQRFRGVIENSPAAFSLKDLEGRFQFINPKFTEWFRLQPEDVIGRTAYDVFPHHSLDVASSLERKVVDTGETHEVDRDIPFADGALHSLALTKFPVLGPDNKIIGIGTINSDITERKRAERALAESRDQLRLVTDNLPEWITYIDVEQRYRFVNKTAAEWLARPVEEIVGKTVSELMGQEYEKFRTLINKVLAGEQQSLIMSLNLPDGATRVLQATYVPHRGTDGNVEGYFTLAVDISELQHAEAALRQAQKMEAVGQLTGGVAHDFNNLLAVVIGNLEMVADDLQADTPIFKYVRNAFTAAEKGASLTQHLLAFSRQQVLRPEETDLAKLISETKELMSVSMGEKIVMEIQTHDNLWHCTVDQAQLQNAILNLSINARDAMPSAGQVTIRTENAPLDAARAEVLALEEGDYVCLSVTDTGPGIPDGVIEHVYEPFFTTKDVGEGSGLGLSMVYGFVQQSGGGVDIETGEGQGTSVRLYFPAIVPDEAEAIEISTEIPDQGSEPNATILLIEDNAAFREVTRAILESLNYRVIDFGTAEEALTVISDTTPFDLLLSDIGLPGDMDGHDLAEFAVSARPGLNIVLMSAHTDPKVIGGVIDDNVAAFLHKPHRKAELGQTLRRVLGLDTSVT